MSGSHPFRVPCFIARRTPIAAAVGLAIAAGALPAHAAVPEPGAALGDQFLVNTSTWGAQDSAAVAMDAAGDFVVAWESYSQDSDATEILAQRYHADGTPVGAEFQVNTYTEYEQENPAVAMDAAGNFVVVWESYNQDGQYNGVFAQRYQAGGAPAGAEFQVNTYTANDQGNPAVAMGAAGNFVVVWESRDQDGQYNGVFAQRYQADGTPAGTEFQVNTYTADDQEDPAVAMDPAGNFVVAWYGDDREDIFAQRYQADGAPAGAEFQVNTSTSGDQEDPAVAIDAAGDFMVAWFSEGPDGYGIFAQRYQAGGAADGSEFQVADGFDAGSPVVAMDAAGDFVVAWEQDNKYGPDAISARRYQADGTAMGSEFQVNTFTRLDQHDPVVAMDAAGDCVVGWSGENGKNIFARRYTRAGSIDLRGTLALAPDNVARGGSLTLTAGVDNLQKPVTPTGYTTIDAALAPSFGVTAALTIPDGVTVANTAGTNWTCPAAPADGVLACTYGGKLPAATQSETLTVTVTAPDVAASLDFNNAVFGDQPDANSDNNTAVASAATAESAPVAKAGALTVNEGAAGIGKLKATDADKDALTYRAASEPAHGSVIVQSNGTFVYVPSAGYSGADSFTFKANDGFKDSNAAKVGITIAARTRADNGGTTGGAADTGDGGGGGLGFIGLLALGLSFVGRRRFGRAARRGNS